LPLLVLSSNLQNLFSALSSSNEIWFDFSIPWKLVFLVIVVLLFCCWSLSGLFESSIAGGTGEGVDGRVLHGDGLGLVGVVTMLLEAELHLLSPKNAFQK
jgi:hypothetical protein